MSSSANTPAPVLNRNSSDDEILGLVTQLPHLARRNGRREANGNGREATAKILEPNPDDQLEIDFAVDEVPKGRAEKFYDERRDRAGECRRGGGAGTLASGAGCES